MTYLDTLKMLAEAQVRHNPDQMMFVPGQRILQLVAVIEAAKWLHVLEGERLDALTAALAELEVKR